MRVRFENKIWTGFIALALTKTMEVVTVTQEEAAEIRRDKIPG